MPMPRRRRTRSRRTTRRLHRTRRHRQRGGEGPSSRKDLTEWINSVKQVVAALGKSLALDDSISEKLKRDELTLTRENAPLLPRLTGASEAFGSSGKEASEEHLLAAAASIVEQLGADTFASPRAFKEKITRLRNDPSNENIGQLLEFMSDLERHLRGDEQVVNLTDDGIYPLYIWFAVANYDLSTTDDVLVPILSDAPTEPTPGPSLPAE